MPAYHLRFQTPTNVPSSGRARIYDNAAAVARVSSLPTYLTRRIYTWGAFTRACIRPSCRKCAGDQPGKNSCSCADAFAGGR